MFPVCCSTISKFNNQNKSPSSCFELDAIVINSPNFTIASTSLLAI